MKIPFGKPIIESEEKSAVAKVLEGTTLVHGPKALEFENAFKEYTNSNDAISVSSCTAGMHLIYFTLGIGPGDEVIVSSQTHVATAHAIELTGAKPIFVDSNSVNGNIDIKQIESKINKNTKAIAVVHYLGEPVDMNEVMILARKFKLFVLEDCALALGSKIGSTHAGLIGDAGVFSFYPVKHMTTGEGGIIILNNNKLSEQLRLKKAFGVDKTHLERKLPGLYDVRTLGFNYRMSEINAAIGIEQIKKLPRFLNSREENYLELHKLLSNIEEIDLIPESNSDFISSRYSFTIIIKSNSIFKRHEVMHKLTESEIGTSVYYPHPVPRLKYYENKYGFDENKFLNSVKFSDMTISLPVGPHLNPKDMQYIAKCIKQIIRSQK